MPEGWSLNPWTLSPWPTDPGLDAALDTGALGGGRAAPSLRNHLPRPVPVLDPDDYGPSDWYAHFAANWPEVPNVIDPEDQVLGWDTSTVLEWVNASLAPERMRTGVVCYHYATYQMHLAKQRTSGPPARDSDSFLVIREYATAGDGRVQEIQLTEAVRAIRYLRDALAAGIPVMLGVKIAGYAPEPNNRYRTPYVVPTDHFVVAVGAGLDRSQPYVRYYDYGHAYDDAADRLLLQPLMTMDNPSNTRRLTEVRRSACEP